MYGELGLFIDGEWNEERRRQQGRGRDQSGDREAAGASAARQQGRSRRGAGIRARRASRSGSANSAYDRCKIMHKAADLMRERARRDRRRSWCWSRARPIAEARGEVIVSADIIDWYAEEGRRSYGRIVPGRGQGRAPARGAGAGRRGRGVHAVEFPGADAGPQDRRRARGRLLAHPQGVGRDARRLRRDGEVLRRRGPARRRAQSRVRRAGGGLRAPARQGRGAQDLVHRLDPGRQASRRSSPPRA